jgi:hypothetical protein
MSNAKTILPAMIIALATLGAATPGLAQKMLASYPTLTTDAALRAAQAALVQCQKQGYTVAVAVADRTGQPLALMSDNLAGPHTSMTAINKAYTAASFRTDHFVLLPQGDQDRDGSARRGVELARPGRKYLRFWK